MSPTPKDAERALASSRTATTPAYGLRVSDAQSPMLTLAHGKRIYYRG